MKLRVMGAGLAADTPLDPCLVHLASLTPSGGFAGQCSCQDCDASCGPKPPPIPPPTPWKILGVDGWAVVGAGLALLFVLVFGTYAICDELVTSRSGEPMTVEGEYSLGTVLVSASSTR